MNSWLTLLGDRAEEEQLHMYSASKSRLISLSPLVMTHKQLTGFQWEKLQQKNAGLKITMPFTSAQGEISSESSVLQSNERRNGREAGDSNSPGQHSMGRDDTRGGRHESSARHDQQLEQDRVVD